MADHDVSIREDCKPNGDKYYEYFLAYVNDLLLVSHDAKGWMEELYNIQISFLQTILTHLLKFFLVVKWYLKIYVASVCGPNTCKTTPKLH